MNALSKATIADKLCHEFGLSKIDAKDMVEQFYEEIRSTLEKGHHVKLSSFGNFILRDKSSRPGRNPKTGEEVSVQARRVVTFRPSLKLKSKVDSPRAK